jgi:hypothetical protein
LINVRNGDTLLWEEKRRPKFSDAGRKAICNWELAARTERRIECCSRCGEDGRAGGRADGPSDGTRRRLSSLPVTCLIQRPQLTRCLLPFVDFPYFFFFPILIPLKISQNSFKLFLNIINIPSLDKSNIFWA